MALSAKYLPLAGCSILLVENDPVIAQSIADCLQDAGASCTTDQSAEAQRTAALNAVARALI
jgi:CheY-like chemotaxis protein